LFSSVLLPAYVENYIEHRPDINDFGVKISFDVRIIHVNSLFDDALFKSIHAVVFEDLIN
jgi:hypothetical protein